MFLTLPSNVCLGFCFSMRNCEIVASTGSYGYVDLIIFFPFHLSPFPSPLLSVSLSPFTVMEYFIDILGVWGRAMTPQ